MEPPAHLHTPTLALLDIDGTLADTAPDLAACVDQMLAEVKRPPAGIDKTRSFIGNGIDRLIHRGLTDEMWTDADIGVFTKAREVFLRLYDDNICEKSVLYPGAAAMLSTLRDAGVTLAAVTNKAERFTLPLLDKLGIADFFSLVVSGDTLPDRKPSPTQLLHACDRLGIPPNATVMVGDSINDLRAARSAKVPIICVTYGYANTSELRAAKPNAIVDSLDEVAELLGI